MTTIPYKGHVFTFNPAGILTQNPGLDVSCGPHWLMRIRFDFTPNISLNHWLDRAIELITTLNLTGAC